MLEYCIIISNSVITSDMRHKLSNQYEERTILDGKDKKLSLNFFNDRSLLLGKSRYDYQGPYSYEKYNNQRSFLDTILGKSHPKYSFTCLVGYIVSSSFENDKTNIVSQLHHLLLSNSDRDWLKNCLGEFQIIHYDGSKLEIICSDTMTHPVFYRESPNAIYISNRASFNKSYIRSMF